MTSLLGDLIIGRTLEMIAPQAARLTMHITMLSIDTRKIF